MLERPLSARLIPGCFKKNKEHDFIRAEGGRSLYYSKTGEIS